MILILSIIGSRKIFSRLCSLPKEGRLTPPGYPCCTCTKTPSSTLKWATLFLDRLYIVRGLIGAGSGHYEVLIRTDNKI